jgi:hypothetical protein
VRLEGLGQLKKIQLPHRALNPQPSDLQHNASTNYATACPKTYNRIKNSSIMLICQDEHTAWLLASMEYTPWGKNIGRGEEEKRNQNI